MIEHTFNLNDRPWITVLLSTDSVEELNFREIFTKAADIRELSGNSPLVNIAVLRLLLAIIHAAAWRNDDVDDKREKWSHWWKTGTLPLAEIEAYLQKWHDRFDLFDARRPFMQTGGLEMKETSTISRLAFEENNTTDLFAFPENPIWENPAPAQAARLLLATQAFALGFGKSSKAKINGIEIEPPYTADAPLLRGLTVWLTGKTLLETLLLNLAPSDPGDFLDDAPSWELDAPEELRDQQIKGKRRTIPPRGPMDCFTWHSRLIRLIPESEKEQIVVRNAYFTQGRSIEDKTHFDPMKVYMASKKEGVFALGLSEQKAAWRDASSIFCTPATGHPCAAINEVGLQVSLKRVERHHLYRIQTVGLATEPGKAGKFLLWRHDRIPAPVSLLNDENGASRIHTATEEAEDIANQLYGRFKEVAQLFDAPNMGHEGAKAPNPDAVSNIIDAFDPRRDFWTRLETPFYEYLTGLVADADTALEKWRDMLEREARGCFKAARDALGTSPRALRTAAISNVFRTKARRAANNAQRAAKAAALKAQEISAKEVK